MRHEGKKSFSSGKLLKKGDFIAHNCSGWRGMSGGPILTKIGSDCVIIGIYSGQGSFPLVY